MEDITPELLKKIQNEYEHGLKESKYLKEVQALSEAGKLDYVIANKASVEIGNIFSSALKGNISADNLPDGKMYYNIASRIIGKTLTAEYNAIADITEETQNILNKKANIGIKAIRPEINKDRINGIVNRIVSEDDFNDVAWMLDSPVKEYGQSVVNDAVQKNAEFQSKAGMMPKIIRKSSGHCCEWCSKLEGIYVYPDVPKDVYRRHRGCDCTVEYDPGDGRRQNVHTKTWKADAGTLEKRKKTGYVNEEKIKLKKGTEVTDEYMKARYPGQGKIIYDDNYDKKSHIEEINMAEWLHKKFGGDVKLLTESIIRGEKRPDYVWNGKYWELKTTTTEKAANAAIRKGLKQIKDNPGGIILNYNNKVDVQEVVNNIEKRMKDTGNSNNIHPDVMIIINGKVKTVLRY
ncbi:MAG: hypothetical protein NC393_08145 [Clostridium sp.]|nr:hypothetical protein [Clostridium sp.]MCM1209107.1 hypothetical protein [Ruminococcus sp.]